MGIVRRIRSAILHEVVYIVPEVGGLEFRDPRNPIDLKP